MKAISRLLDWGMEGHWWRILFVSLLFVLVVSVPIGGLVVWLDSRADRLCRESGGERVAVGHHTQLMPVLVGKVTVLTPMRVTDWACLPLPPPSHLPKPPQECPR